MTKITDIATLTMNPVVDKSCDTDRVLPDRKLRCSEPRFEPGGGGINVARAVRRLGGEAVAFYPAGGFAGRFFESLLEEEGVPHQSVATEEMTRVNLIVRETETGQQFRFGMPGPALKEGEWREMLNVLSHLTPFPAFLVVSGSLPPGVPAEFYREVAQLARQHAGRLIVDSSGDGLRHALDQGVFLVKPNLRELRQVVGAEELGEENEIIAAARQLVEQGRSAIVVVSVGRGGAVLVSKENCAWVRAPSVSIQSKVGAGDSMVAGITLTLARGGSERDAVCFGVAAGAAAVMTPGSELCRRTDTERFYEQVKRHNVRACGEDAKANPPAAEVQTERKEPS